MTENLLWIDLETTGLSAQDDVPLELGLILTNKWGDELASHSWLVYEEDNVNFMNAVDNCPEVVERMHHTSGLWLALENEESYTRDNLDRVACRWLQSQGVPPGVIPMTGSSIGSLDRPFVQHHFPNLNKFFNYRNVDISSIKEICARLNPVLFEQVKELIGGKETAAHRVLEDCRGSIYEYTLYVENFLIVGDDE